MSFKRSGLGSIPMSSSMSRSELAITSSREVMKSSQSWVSCSLTARVQPATWTRLALVISVGSTDGTSGPRTSRKDFGEW